MSRDTIDASRIDATPMETGGGTTTPVSSDPLRPDPIISQKMGWLGRCFGYGEEKKGNIAGVAFVASLLLLVCVVLGTIWASTPETRQILGNLITPLFGVMTGSLGYLTAKKSD
jgi:hypothetical protein